MPTAAKRVQKNNKAAKPKKKGKAARIASFEEALKTGLANADALDRATNTVVDVIPSSAMEVIVDTPMDAMMRGAPPRESVGHVVPPAPALPTAFLAEGVVPEPFSPPLGELLQQPFALANGGTAWVQDIRWDVGTHGNGTIRISIVTNDAGTTPIHDGDGYVINSLGEREPVVFRRSPTTMQYHSQTQVNMDILQTASVGVPVMLEDLTRCISDQLTMEMNSMVVNSMVGQPNNEATWNQWCGRQRLLTSASSGTFTVTNTSSATNVTGGTLNYGGIFDDCTGNTTTATNVWASPEWIRAEHSAVISDRIRQQAWPHIQRQAETAEQRIAREEREVRQAAETEKRLAAQRKKDAERRRFQEEGKERARRLLASMLTPEQREEFEAENRFHLKVIDGKSGEERVYRIDQGYQGNVKLLGPDGRPIKSYCIHSATTDDEGNRLPNEDHMLAQKLLLQTDEERFLQVANMTPVRH